jgi:hypothetical protein
VDPLLQKVGHGLLNTLAGCYSLAHGVSLSFFALSLRMLAHAFPFYRSLWTSPWQIQAKNTASVRLDDVAKEVGLALTFIYSNVVMLVTTGDFTRDAYAYANHVMKTSNLNIILLNGRELERISNDPTDIVAVLNSKAERAMQIKERNDYFEKQ